MDPASATRSVILDSGDGVSVEYERARLLVQAGPDEGLEFKLSERPVILGRGEDADLRLADRTVSRSHAVLQPVEGGWKIQDMGSKSGIRVDDTPVEVAPLRDGSRIRLGETVVEFRIGKTELRAPPHETHLFEGLLGESSAMKRVFGLIEKIAALDLPVILLGESGTGKESLARAVHRFGPAPEGPYEVVDCTLLEREHLRSELFGHVKGSFTGADADRTGALERADGGTVFFDEVAELPLELQPALLRALQEGEIRPLGSDAARKVRVRVVSATNRDVEAMVRAGEFRQDLYYRLSALTIEVPPLRARAEDVLLLAEHFLPQDLRLSDAAQERLMSYSWPGNVRELENVIRRAGALAEGEEVSAEDLGPLEPGPEPTGSAAAYPRPTTGPGTPAESARTNLGDAVADQEARSIQDALERSGGNRKEAAKLLGISRATLYRKLKKLGID